MKHIRRTHARAVTQIHNERRTETRGKKGGEEDSP